jgi:methionyl-tRNA formyltransferase
MSIVLFASRPTAGLYLDALIAAGAPPSLVVTSARASLTVACERHGLPIERCDDPNAPRLLAQIQGLTPDFVLFVGVDRLLSPDLCAAPRLAALHFHPSLLPAYRAREPLFWALLHGEPIVGLTVQRLTAHSDAGIIVLQREIPVPAHATSASLAAIIDHLGASLLPDLLARARAGALPHGAPLVGAGSHFPPLRAEHGLLDFTRSASEIDRLVRAAQGEVHTYTFFRGVRFNVLEGEPIGESVSAALPGCVVAVDDNGIAISTPRGVYRARRFLYLDRYQDGPSLAAALGLDVGATLTANPAF